MFRKCLPPAFLAPSTRKAPLTRILQLQTLPPESPKPSSALAPCTEDISHLAPSLKPTFNFAAYVNKSETLQELLKLGVDLHKLECKKGVAEYILRLNFEADVRGHVEFLHDLGLSVEEVGGFITKCPEILKEDVGSLRVRVNYLLSKKFTHESVSRIASANPAWLTFSTQDVDRRLGYFQKEYRLTGDQVRAIATNKPALVTCELRKIELKTFALKEEMGFDEDEIRRILLKSPGIFLRGQNKLLRSFEYLHKTMGVPHDLIVQDPNVLTCRLFRLQERHLFLEKLGRSQLDPKKPNYVSLRMLASGSDAHFCTEVAKSSIQTYNLFLKSL